MEKYLLSIDQGTTSTRVIIFNKYGDVIVQINEEIKQYYPQPGWVEHDAMEIYSKTLGVITEAVAASSLSLNQIEAIGITNQRETIVVWDKLTGKPVYHAIVWQSTQSKEICDRFEDKKDIIKAKTGLLINPYFSASKLTWLFETHPDIYQRAKNGELLCGTIDTWLLYKLTNGKVHATDYSNASRTLLFNIHTLTWDDELLEMFKIPRCILPEIKNCSGIFGYIDESILPSRIPIAGMAGDQQAALFGQCCFTPGSLKNTYGTGCFALMNTGNEIVDSKKGLLSTIAWVIDGKPTYALEGSVFIGGASVQWLRDELRMFREAADSEEYARKAISSEGVYVVPAFTGLGTPYWDDECKGAIFGLTRGTSKEIFIRATLESIAYQSKDVIETMKKETGFKLKELSVDGGATHNNFLMQFQSDILSCKICLQSTAQSTALGAAYLAGLAVGYYKDMDEIISLRKLKKVFTPNITKKEADKLYKGWKLAIKAARVFKPSED